MIKKWLTDVVARIRNVVASMDKRLLIAIIAGVAVIALVLGLVLGLSNCAGTTEPTDEPTDSSPTGEPTEKPTKAPKPSKDTASPEPGGTSYYSGMPDYSWYDADEIYEEYTLYTADAFMAFVDLVNTGTNFQGITIKLAANLVFNNGDASKWTRDDTELMNWTSIGSKAANPFSGTLDGQGYYISGLYGVKGRDNGFMLYGVKATVKNLAIVNSYFCNTGGNQKDAQVLGGVVARAYGCTLQNIYCDAILEGGGYNTGGIAAFARDTWTLNKTDDAKDVLIDSCVFAGVIKGCVGNNVGGILGSTDGVNVKQISNCLNLGSIESTVGSVGGIAGALGKETVMINCVNAGKIVTTDKNYDRVALVGKPGGDTTVKNSYFANVPGAKPFGSGTPSSSGILGIARASMKGTQVSAVMPGLDFQSAWTALENDYPIPTGVAAMYNAHKKAVEEDTGNGGDVWKNQTGSTDTGKADTSWYKEGETSFTLTTADQLYGLAKLVNDGKTTFKGVTIKLGADFIINTGDASNWDGETTGLRAWKSIGTSAAKSFQGTLDGQGHYISGLYSRTDRDNGFICYAMNATVKNLGIVNSYFENYGREHSSGYLSAQVLGSFVGRAYGTTLQNLYSNARLIIPAEAQGYNTGGIAGFAKSKGTESKIEYGASSIDSCVFAGTITTNNKKDSLTGGILGGTDGSYTVVKNCLFRGQINAQGSNIGGIAGKLDKESVMEDCVSVGNVNSNIALVGAVTGAVQINDSYYVKISGGKAYSGTPKEGKTTALARANMKGTGVASAMTGLDFSSKWTALTDDYPIPTGVKALHAAFKQAIPGGESDGAESGGSTHVPGTPDTTWYKEGQTSFTLTTADQLFGFAQLVNEGNTFQGVTVKLGADIVINQGDSSSWGTTAPARVWKPIGSGKTAYFAGVFDGQGHYISGLYTAEKENNGLFGWTANAEIKNLAVINSYFKAIGRDKVRSGKTYKMSGQMLASFVARGYGTALKNLYSNATLHYAASANHEGDWCTAGIVGILTSPGIGLESEAQESGAILVTKQAVIDGCVFAGKIISDGTNATTGAGVGGILGSANGKPITIKNCLFVGEIESNDKQVGGIAGILANGSTLESCVSVGVMNAASSDVTVWGAIVGEAGGTVSLKNNYYSETLNLPLYGKKSKVNDENTNAVLPDAQLSGPQVTTTMKLTYGAGGWTVQENDYPVPTGVLAMYQAHKAPHTHAWTESWVWNETHHWHNCSNVGCSLTDPSQKGGYGKHVYDNENDKECNTCGRLNANYYEGGSDTSWYVGHENDSTFILTTPAQLYGLAEIVNDGVDTFEGQTIKLGANMVFNTGDASTWSTTPPATNYVWTPIGDGTKVSNVIHDYFAGTFDGQGHFLSGLYINQGVNGAFFQWTFDAKIQNLSIINSYYKHQRTDGNGQGLATFVSRAYGTDLKNLYTDAILENLSHNTKEGKKDQSTWFTGGIAAFGKSNATEAGRAYGDCTIENCVFAGAIIDDKYGAGEGVGGIVGGDDGKVITIRNCLFSGTLSSNDNKVGGIIGRVTAASSIENCVVAGKMTFVPATSTGTAVTDIANWGAVVGHTNTNISIKNCYYDPSATDKTSTSTAINLPLYGSAVTATVADADTNTSLSRDSMKGNAAATNMPKLFAGQEPAWKVAAGGYPIPVGVIIP